MTALNHFTSERARVAAIVGLSSVGSVFEAATLILVVPLAQAVASGESDFRGAIGPFDLQVGTGGLAALALSAVVVSGIVNVIAAFVLGRAVSEWAEMRQNDLYRAFLASGWELQASERVGRLQALSMANVNRGAQGLNQIAIFFRAIAGLLVLGAAAVVVDPLSAVAVIVFVAVLFVALRPLSTRVRRHTIAVNDLGIEASQELNEGHSFSREIRLYDAFEPMAERMAAILRDLNVHRRKAMALNGSVSPLYQSAGLVMLIAALAVAGTADSDIATLGAIALLLVRALRYGQQLQQAHQRLAESMPYVDRLDDGCARFEAATPRYGSAELDSPAQVVLRSVSYDYGDEPALNFVSCDLACGEIVGVAGRSGSGKSTLAQIILRLRPPTRGEVLVDGRAAAEFTEASWYRRFAFVPQQPRLLHATALENIRFLRPWVSEQDCREAADAAGIDEQIRALPDGYATELGASARDLSGGQVQRLGIARALAGRPSVVVLDEPTSALDPETEACIHDSIASLRGRALVVVIAHRASTLAVADRLLVLKDGVLVDDGPLEEVQARSGLAALVDDASSEAPPAPDSGERTDASG